NDGRKTYRDRFASFYDAINAKYPQIKIISAMQTRDKYDHGRRPDLMDDHSYMTIPMALLYSDRYDSLERGGTKVFAGEWATNRPRTMKTPTMALTLGDAAWLTGLERNCDVVTMHCYAPLFVNVNPGGQQWPVNLIAYDAITAFGSPSYYLQKMFSQNRG